MAVTAELESRATADENTERAMPQTRVRRSQDNIGGYGGQEYLVHDLRTLYAHTRAHACVYKRRYAYELHTRCTSVHTSGGNRKLMLIDQ